MSSSSNFDASNLLEDNEWEENVVKQYQQLDQLIEDIAKAKRKDKEVATPSCTIPNNFTASLREMMVTRERECDIQERKIKAAILTPLMARKDLSPEEEALKRDLMAELFGK